LLAALVTITLCTAMAISVVHAQGTTTPTADWFTWDALVEYMAIGAFFGVLHDINDGNGVIIAPHKEANGSWDLGIISPAIFGAAAGFFAQAIPAANVPFLTAIFPTVSGNLPGIFAAVFAGYFYSKTVAVIMSTLQGQTVAAATTFHVKVTAPTGPVTWEEAAATQARIDFLKGQGYTVQVLP
jgi:hypothetical protein